MSSLGLRLAGFPTAGRSYRPSAADDRDELEKNAAFARFTVRLRLRRKKMLGIDGLADPAWDMLLDLFGYIVDEKHVSKSSLVASVDLPQTTGLRWLADLIDAGVMHPYPDPKDGRRVFVGMDEEMFRRLNLLLRSARSDVGFLAERWQRVSGERSHSSSGDSRGPETGPE